MPEEKVSQPIDCADPNHKSGSVFHVDGGLCPLAGYDPPAANEPNIHDRLVMGWLVSNAKTPDEVKWASYPIGMVQRWIERAQEAESTIGCVAPGAAAGPRQFRKKPVVIWAFRYDGQNAAAILFWIGSEEGAIAMREARLPARLARVNDAGVLLIKTLESGEGHHVADPGDWIIKGVKGEFYPCKPDIFAATYEPAAAPAPQEAAPDEKIESMTLSTEPCPDCGMHL